MVHGAVHSLIRLIGALITVFVLGLAIVTWRLSDGPISVDFLAPYVADSISVEGQVQFGIRSAVIAWEGWQDSPEIRILDITATDTEGQIVAVFPEMTVRLSMISILEGTPAPQELILTSPVIQLTRTTEGKLLFLLDPEQAPNQYLIDAPSPPRIESEANNSANLLLEVVVKALVAPGGSTNLPGYLEQATIRDATVIFTDEASGTEWLVPSGNIELQRDRVGLRLNADLPYMNENVNSSVNLNGTYRSEKQDLSLALSFNDVRPSSFSTLIPQISLLAGAELEVSGTLAVDLSLLNATAIVEFAQIKVEDGHGYINLPPPIDRQYPVRRFALDGRSEGNFDSVVIESMVLELDEPDDSGPVIQLNVNGSDLRASPRMAAEISINEIGIDVLGKYWPEGIKPNTRDWIANNLDNGKISNATFDINLQGEDFGKLNVTEFEGKAQLSDIDVTYIRQMPPVIDTSGTLNLGLSEVIIELDGGRVAQLSTGGQLGIQSGRVRLHGLDTESHMADIDLRIDGQLRDAIALIDEEPLRYSSALGISPDATSGDVQILLGIDFPLIQQLSLSEILISAQASMESTGITDAAFGLNLESGQFSLNLDNFGMNVIGTAAIGGIRTGLAWRENFTENSKFLRQYAVDAVIENEQRPLVGLGQFFFKPPYVDGPLRMEAIQTVYSDGMADLVLEADMKNATLSVPQLNWTKPAGVDALFAAGLKLKDDQLFSVDNFSATSAETSLNVNGQVAFNESGDLDTFILDQSSIGNSQFSVNVVRDSDDILDISVEGEVLDGTTFWPSLRQSDQTRSFQDQEQSGGRLPFRFKGKLDRVLLSSKGDIQYVEAEIIQETSGLSHIAVKGMVSDKDSFELSMKPDEERRSYTAVSGNGGAVLRALGLGDDFVEGELKVTGFVQESGAVDGTLNIKSFKIVDAPLLARLLSVASLTGIVDELQGTGISFSELNVPFTFYENNFSVRDGAMYGASLGLTAKGEYNISQNTLEGEGTLIPAYAVNSAFGSIPILGPILTGGEESGGVFAATYAMRGNPEGGEITVNPLATLTPGFLRQIFRIFDPPRTEPRPDEISKSDAATN